MDERGSATSSSPEARVSEPSAKPLVPGTVVGRYVVRSELGRGAVGVVLDAYDPTLSRSVALKLLIAGRDASDAQLRRFLREARAASILRHEHIVAVHDLGEDSGRAYFAMDRIEGRSLGNLLTEGPLAPRRACELALEIARALEHAHGHGIVHRDVKPHNIIIDAQGKSYLTDFGLARDLGEDARLTATGQIVGTPAYAAPEQLAGQPTDERSDIYSLGATLHEAITGSPPFDAGSYPLLSWKVIYEPAPSLRAKRPEVAADVEAVVLTCLEKDPARRYRSAGELAQDLERFLRGEGVRARPRARLRRLAAPLRRHWPIALGAGAGVLGLVLTLGYAAVVRGELRRAQELESNLEAESRRLASVRQSDAARIEKEDGRRHILADLAQVSRTEARIRVLERALALDPGYWEGRCEEASLLRRLARERARAGDAKGAREVARDAIALVHSTLAALPQAPSAPLLLLEAEVARRELRDPAAAGRAYASLAAEPDRGLRAYARARLELARGDAAAAAAPCAEAIGLSPELVPARFLEAELALERKDAAAALAALERAQLLPDAALDAEGFVLRGRAFAARGDPERARADFARALELDPAEPDARRELGLLAR
jgi:predicted Ser/Thr protein kinase/tetratricopeptide (TPR) repeat protein